MKGDRNILNGKGSLGHWHVHYNPGVLLLFWWKNVVGCMLISPSFSHWNNVGPSFLIFNEVHSFHRLFLGGKLTMYVTQPLSALWNWQVLSSRCVQSVLNSQHHVPCSVGKTREFPWYQNKHRQISILEHIDNSCVRNKSQTYNCMFSSCIWAQKSIFGGTVVHIQPSGEVEKKTDCSTQPCKPNCINM